MGADQADPSHHLRHLLHLIYHPNVHLQFQDRRNQQPNVQDCDVPRPNPSDHRIHPDKATGPGVLHWVEPCRLFAAARLRYPLLLEIRGPGQRLTLLCLAETLEHYSCLFQATLLCAYLRGLRFPRTNGRLLRARLDSLLDVICYFPHGLLHLLRCPLTWYRWRGGRSCTSPH